MSFWQKLESGISQSALSNQTFNEGKYAAYQGQDLSKINLTNLTSQQQAQFVEGYRAGRAEMGTASAFGQMVAPEVGIEGLTAKVSQWIGKLGLWSKPIQLLQNDSYGIEKASQELLQAVENKGRTIFIAKQGSEEYRYLEYMGAEANVGGEDLTHIILMENPSKVALLEEFLHGTQYRLGVIDELGIQGAEVQVKDFMIRHQNLLGLGQQDVEIFNQINESQLRY